jgi:flagellar protein FliL
MAAAAETKADKADKPAKAKKNLLRLPSRRVLLIAGAVVVVLGAGGGSAWFVLLRGRAHRPVPAAAHVDHGPAHVWKAGTVVVNVAGTGGRRYLRTTIELGVDPKTAKQLEEHKAQIIDAAIGVLGAEPLDHLLDPAQRDPLRAHLMERLNGSLGRHDVTHVFLTEFVVQ